MLRLTLRTLLAWLDGVLPADEAAAFAEKLGSSGSAKLLVDRIRAVVAHPGLDAPKVLGRGLATDANSVAEYLTNSLPADSVAAFERVCIESDAHLAEAASCHRMLVDARNDPRIFEPPPQEELDRILAATRGAPQAAPGRAAPARRSPEAAVSRSLPPVEAGKRSSTAWASVVVAVMLVALLAGALGWRLWPKGSRGSTPGVAEAVAVREPPPDAPRARPSETIDATPESDAAELAMKNASPPEPADVATDSPPVAPPVSAEPAPATEQLPATEQPSPPKQPAAASMPVDSRPAVSPPTGRVPGGDAVAIASAPLRGPAGESSVDAEKPAEPASPVEPPKPDEASVAAVAADPLVLARVGTAGEAADWNVLAAGAPLSVSSELLVPEGFSPTLTVGHATVRLIGPARVVLLAGNNAATDAAGAGLELVFGRAIVGGLGKGRPLAVVAGDLTARLEEGDPIGLEVRFERSPGVDPEIVPSTVVTSIAFPAGGRVALDPAVAAGPPLAPDGEGLFRPDGSIATGVVVTARGGGAADAGSAVVPTIAASRAVPDWMDAAASPPRLLDRLAAAAMTAGLSAAPAPAALDRLLEDRRLENRAAAAATLAVMGRYEPLAELLAAEEPGQRLPARAWERLERATVPFALARGPKSAGRMLSALESVVPPDAAKLVRQLAVGFSDEAVAAGGDAALVASLEHPSLLVRRLATARLLELVPLGPADRLRYRPDGPQDARAEAVKWWRTQLEKGRIHGPGEGGLSKAEGE